MAQIVEERITLVISRMVKDGMSNTESSVSDETKDALTAVCQELVGDDAMVEIIEGQ